MAKHIFREWWDDYQLRAMKLGGNAEFLQIVSEIQLPNDNVECRHRHALVKWYRERHIALLDEIDFAVPRPDVEAANKELKWVSG